MTLLITVSIIVLAQRHMTSSESLITSYFIFVIIYLKVVVFQFHTCTHPNFTSLLEQQAVSPCELMIANEAMYTIDVNTRVDNLLTLVHTCIYMTYLLQYTVRQSVVHVIQDTLYSRHLLNNKPSRGGTSSWAYLLQHLVCHMYCTCHTHCTHFS